VLINFIVILNKQDFRRINDSYANDLASDDEWTVEENEANSTLDALDEDI